MGALEVRELEQWSSVSQGCGSGSGMDPDYFWKLDPDPHWSEKLEVALIAYSKQKEIPRATGQM
jgi:hypothetical protein